MKEKLINFEKKIIGIFEEGRIPYMLHLAGGNEDQLIKIFKKIKKTDYIFSTHRNHYHYLLAGGKEETLEKEIINGNSMFMFDKKLNFLTSSIVCGTPSIATGVALALKRKKSKRKVWCFVGDGAEDEGHFYEAVRYVDGWKLPCTFIIEDNSFAVNDPKKERWNREDNCFKFPKCVMRYKYKRTYPHVGYGSKKMIDFSKWRKNGKKI